MFPTRFCRLIGGNFLIKISIIGFCALWMYFEEHFFWLVEMITSGGMLRDRKEISVVMFGNLKGLIVLMFGNFKVLVDDMKMQRRRLPPLPSFVELFLGKVDHRPR